MKKIVVLLVVMLAFVSCKQKEEPVAIIAKPAEKHSTPKQQPKKVLGDYMDCKKKLPLGSKTV